MLSAAAIGTFTVFPVVVSKLTIAYAAGFADCLGGAGRRAAGMLTFNPFPALLTIVAITGIMGIGSNVIHTPPADIAAVVVVFVNMVFRSGIQQTASVCTLALNAGCPCAILMAKTCNKATAIVAETILAGGSIKVQAAKALDFFTALAANTALTSYHIMFTVAIDFPTANFADKSCAVCCPLGTLAIQSNFNISGGDIYFCVGILKVPITAGAIPMLDVTGGCTVDRILRRMIFQVSIMVGFDFFFIAVAADVTGVGHLTDRVTSGFRGFCTHIVVVNVFVGIGVNRFFFAVLYLIHSAAGEAGGCIGAQSLLEGNGGQVAV